MTTDFTVGLDKYFSKMRHVFNLLNCICGVRVP